MRLNVLKTCSKIRICSDEHFLIQQKGFFYHSKDKHPLQSGHVSRNTLTTVLCMCGASLAFGRTCPGVSGRTSPGQTISKYHVTAPFRMQEEKLKLCDIKAHYPFIIII